MKGVWFLALPVVLAFQTPSMGPPKPLKHGPLAYYKDHCARCHGDMGGAYPDDFTKDKTVGDIRDVVKSMAAGQGGSALTDNSELEAQVAFHYAIDLKKPFIDWVGQDGLKLSGEVSPDAKVSATLGTTEFSVKVEKGTWKLILPPDADVHTVILKAVLGDARAILDLGKAPFSSVAPAAKSGNG